MKLVDVFMMETWVADVPRARAVVKRDHICIVSDVHITRARIHTTPLKMRLRMKKDWLVNLVHMAGQGTYSSYDDLYHLLMLREAEQVRNAI